MQTQHVNQPEEKLLTRTPWHATCEPTRGDTVDHHATCEATRIQNDEKTSLTRYVKQQEWIMLISPRRHMDQQNWTFHREHVLWFWYLTTDVIARTCGTWPCVERGLTPRVNSKIDMFCHCICSGECLVRQQDGKSVMYPLDVNPSSRLKSISALLESVNLTLIHNYV